MPNAAIDITTILGIKRWQERGQLRDAVGQMRLERIRQRLRLSNWIWNCCVRFGAAKFLRPKMEEVDYCLRELVAEQWFKKRVRHEHVGNLASFGPGTTEYALGPEFYGWRTRFLLGRLRNEIPAKG